MGQKEIMEILEEADEPLSLQDIQKRIDKSNGCIGRSVTKLRERGEIRYVMKESDRGKIIHFYYL